MAGGTTRHSKMKYLAIHQVTMTSPFRRPNYLNTLQTSVAPQQTAGGNYHHFLPLLSSHLAEKGSLDEKRLNAAGIQ